MLKFIVNNLEDVEEALRPLYKVAADGKFHLQTEADPDAKKKVDEFRDNNVKLMKELDEMKKKYGNIDPEKVKELEKMQQDIDDKKMLDVKGVDELVAQKTERMRQDYEDQIAELKKTIDAKSTELNKTAERLSEVLIDGEITKAATAIGGVRPGAMEDIIARGRRVWRLEEGKPVPKEGDKILYGKDAKEIMTFDEWARVLATSAPFLFEPSSGGGAGGAGGAGGGSKKFGGRDLSKIPAQERLRMIHADVAE
jgi:hypothetical protein